MKWLALGCLCAALGGLLVSRWIGNVGVWPWVGAFCEAAAVGALADWFAVVALFRRPLGLPIPHTALIPANKARLADQVADFVGENFLSQEALRQKLQAFNPAGRLAEFLRDARRMDALAGHAQAVAQQGLALLNEPAARRAIHEFLLSRARSIDVSSSAAGILQLLTEGGRHQQLLDEALGQLRRYLSKPEVKQLFAKKMVSYVEAEWPKIALLVNTVSSTDKLAAPMADKLALELMNEIEHVLSEPRHEVRQAYQYEISQFIRRLNEDHAFRQQIDGVKHRLIESQDVSNYVHGLLNQIMGLLAADLAHQDSAVMGQLKGLLRQLGERLANDPALSQAINTHVLETADRLAGDLKSGVTGHIAGTVKSWDDEKLVTQLELGVGRDLQFIRLNGTLVGGVIGMVLFAVERFMHLAH